VRVKSTIRKEAADSDDEMKLKNEDIELLCGRICGMELREGLLRYLERMEYTESSLIGEWLTRHDHGRWCKSPLSKAPVNLLIHH